MFRGAATRHLLFGYEWFAAVWSTLVLEWLVATSVYAAVSVRAAIAPKAIFTERGKPNDCR
jgi:hypothetical protein